MKFHKKIFYSIILNEENSGMTDHKFHKQLTDEVCRGWIELLNKSTIKNKPIGDNPDEFFNNEHEINLQTLSSFKNIPTEFPRDFSLVCIIRLSQKKINGVFQGASFSYEKKKPNEGYVILIVNPEMTVDFILKQNNAIEGFASHEVSHFIKHLHCNYQKDSSHFDAQLNRKEYLSYKHELESNIPKINTELKNVKNRFPDISYIDAVKLSQTFREYDKFVFDIDKKIYKKVISKTLHYWKTDLKGKTE